MKYIGFFSSDEDEGRVGHMSSKNKMLYICKSIEEIGYVVELISPSWTKKKKNLRGKKTSFGEKSYLVLGPTISFTPFLSQIYSLGWLFLYLLFKTKKTETIIVYHSLVLIPIIWLCQLIKKLDVILEVEEVYSQVVEERRWLSKIEYSYINRMDKRILVSDTLKKQLDTGKNVKDIILYGSYHDKSTLNTIKIPKSLVYAGSIDVLKGGAFIAIDLMEHLKSEDIKLYILGTGTQENVKIMLEKIDLINQKKGFKAINYIGKKEGLEFDSIMNKFDIGLNIQKLGTYMDTAFPSKILSYLSYNQVVISSKIKSIMNSPFNKRIYFVESNNSLELADEVERIIELKRNKEIKPDFIAGFHETFKKELKELLK